MNRFRNEMIIFMMQNYFMLHQQMAYNTMLYI
jgi:hypothetical protein